MAVIKLDERPAVWFDYPAGGRVLLRPPMPEKLREIRKMTTTKKADIRKVDGVYQRFAYDETDDDLQNELLWDHIIADWEGMTDDKGDAVPCTKENKIRAMNRDKEFNGFFNVTLAALIALDSEQLEASEKN